MPILSYSSESESTERSRVGLRRRLHAHLRITRLDHSIKQIFILPGIVLAIALMREPLTVSHATHVCIGIISATLIACSNYVINEILDAPFDRMHPTKKHRPAARGEIRLLWGYAQWIAMMLAGVALAATISPGFLLTASALWLMGCVYNIAPIRAKDLCYIDVLTESINNPLRLCLGWYMVTAKGFPPIALLLSYWMLGAYFMALKRFSEYRQLDDAVATRYRRSFRFYCEKTLLNSALFYAAASALLFCAFVLTHRLELILGLPMIIWLMYRYFRLSFCRESPVQNPEKLFRESRLMWPLALCATVMVALLFIDLPWLGAELLELRP